ncbi:MAG: hypothetical protein COC24_006335 [Alphaproteobacteria bacterium]|nr:hypothetical protein [Alphaproteobacteria bacterium]
MARIAIVLTTLCRIFIFLMLFLVMIIVLDESFFTLLLEYIKTLIWPFLIVFFILRFRRQLENLFGRLKSAKFGGAEAEFDSGAEEAMAASEKIKEEQKPTLAPVKNEEEQAYGDVHIFQNSKGETLAKTSNTLLKEEGLQASPSNLDMKYYRDIASKNPALALSGVRTELEILTSNLLLKNRGVKLYRNTRGRGVYRIIQTLFREEIISESQSDLARSIIKMCNSAVHGDYISYSKALVVIANMEIFIGSIDIIFGKSAGKTTE